MPQSDKHFAATELSTGKKKLKKKESKKSLAERLAGKAPFDWLKVDATNAMGK